MSKLSELKDITTERIENNYTENFEPDETIQEDGWEALDEDEEDSIDTPTETPIKEGDVVYLNAGGPALNVVKVYPKAGTLHCGWFDLSWNKYSIDQFNIVNIRREKGSWNKEKKP